MGQMSQEEINSSLFDEVQRQRQEIRKMERVINDIEKAYRGSGEDLEVTLDEYFYGGKSPIRKGK